MIRVHVYLVPDQLSNGYCFNRTVPVAFGNVDWFQAVPGSTREALANFIRAKKYFDPSKRYLVLTTPGDLTFVLEPSPVTRN